MGHDKNIYTASGPFNAKTTRTRLAKKEKKNTMAKAKKRSLHNMMVKRCGCKGIGLYEHAVAENAGRKYGTLICGTGCTINTRATEARYILRIYIMQKQKLLKKKSELTSLSSHMLADGHQHVRRHEVGVLCDLGRILCLNGTQLVHVDEVHTGDLVG